MIRRISILLGLLALLIAPADAFATPLQRLEHHMAFWAISITDAGHPGPVRDPSELQLTFGAIASYETETSGAALFWQSNCNSHSYALRVTKHRFRLTEGFTTAEECTEPGKREERWLDRFFDADPRWSLHRGRLTLTSSSRRIVLRDLKP
jgi:META domain